MGRKTRDKDMDSYSEEETRDRVEAALRGARIAGHKPMSEIAPKRKPGKFSKRTKSPSK